MAEYDLVRGGNRIVFSRFTPPPIFFFWDGMGESCHWPPPPLPPPRLDPFKGSLGGFNLPPRAPVLRGVGRCLNPGP